MKENEPVTKLIKTNLQFILLGGGVGREKSLFRRNTNKGNQQQQKKREHSATQSSTVCTDIYLCNMEVRTN